MVFDNAISLILTGLVALASSNMDHVKTDDRKVARNGQSQVVRIDNDACLHARSKTDQDWRSFRRVTQKCENKKRNA